MREDLNKPSEWSRNWKMLFNVNKYKIMHFGKKTHFPYSMNGQELVCMHERDWESSIRMISK